MAGKPFALIDINGSDNLTRLKQVAKEKQFSWRSVNNQSVERKISTEWNIRDWPTLYVIDGQGIIRHKWVGAAPEKYLDKRIEEIVTEVANSQNARRASR